MTSVVLPEGLKRIETFAFAYCENLSALHLPGTVTQIESRAFLPYNGILNFTVASANPAFSAVDGVLMSKEADKLVRYPAARNECSYTVPGGVTTIGNSAFAQAHALETLRLPESVERIEADAFCYCVSLQEITLPQSLTSIADSAFDNSGNVVATVYGGSYAHQWCLANDVAVNVITEYDELHTRAEIDSPKFDDDLTDYEKQLIANGAELMVWLEMEDVTDSLNPQIIKDKVLIESVKGEGNITHYFDIDLFKQIGMEETTRRQITESPIGITIVITIPNEYREDPLLLQREYGIIRVHNGKAEKLNCHYDRLTGELSFVTDGFSTYALYYEDSVMETAIPHTGDDANIILWSLLFCISVFGIITFVLKKRAV